jgi:hypothetical protein
MNYNNTIGINRLEKASNASAYKLNSIIETSDRAALPTLLQDGDKIIIGILPEHCLVNDIRYLIKGTFPADATIDINLISNNVSNALPDVLNIVNGSKINAKNTTVVIPVPASGNRNPDGSAYAGENASIWVGSPESAVEVTMHLPTPIPEGKEATLYFCFGYNYYKQGNGAYV